MPANMPKATRMTSEADPIRSDITHAVVVVNPIAVHPQSRR
jgi:hypothetical protein